MKILFYCCVVLLLAMAPLSYLYPSPITALLGWANAAFYFYLHGRLALYGAA